MTNETPIRLQEPLKKSPRKTRPGIEVEPVVVRLSPPDVIIVDVRTEPVV